MHNRLYLIIFRLRWFTIIRSFSPFTSWRWMVITNNIALLRSSRFDEHYIQIFAVSGGEVDEQSKIRAGKNFSIRAPIFQAPSSNVVRVGGAAQKAQIYRCEFP